MHTQEHFANTVKAVAAAAGAVGLAVAAITGSTPEFLTPMYLDKIAAVVLTVASAFYALRNRPVEPAPEEPVA